MRIRPSSPADLEPVVELVGRTNIADLGSRETSVEEVRENWARPGYETWVAEEAGGLLGYVYLYERSPGVAYVDAHVDPPARGRGLEPALVATAERRARERGLAVANAFAVTAEMGTFWSGRGTALPATTSRWRSTSTGLRSRPSGRPASRRGPSPQVPTTRPSSSS